MSRWSDLMKFNPATLNTYKIFLSRHGVYELGFLRNEYFTPKYIGKAERQTFYYRLGQYFQLSRESKIPPQLHAHVYQQKNMIWFRVQSPVGPAETERRMLLRHWIGKDGGVYEWNRRYE